MPQTHPGPNAKGGVAAYSNRGYTDTTVAAGGGGGAPSDVDKAYVDAQIATRVGLAGGVANTMTGPLMLSGPPAIANHAATKGYVDSNSGIPEAPNTGALYGRIGNPSGWTIAMPNGGLLGQVLAKYSNLSYDTIWADASTLPFVQDLVNRVAALEDEVARLRNSS
jgi:hypothetical protein